MIRRILAFFRRKPKPSDDDRVPMLEPEKFGGLY